MYESRSRTSEDRLASEEAIERVCMRNLLASTEERVFFKDRDSRFLLVSAGWLEALGNGATHSEVVGRTDFDFFSKAHAIDAFADEQHIMATGEAVVGKLERETFADRPDNWVSTTKLPLRDEDGRIIGTFGISRDVTAQIAAQDALERQALHDPLTGVANRTALLDRLTQALVGLERTPGRLALLFLDLDDFKIVNEEHGHDGGDQVLVEISRRLHRFARRTDTIARLGGDEFVLLLTSVHAHHDVRLIGDRILRELRAPIELGAGGVVSGTASLGAVTATDPHSDPRELLQQVDFAMREAKRAGGNRLEVFDPELHVLVTGVRRLAADLRRAIDNRELFVLYQPVLSLEDGSLASVEALVRWRHPERGIVPPAEFIPIAERQGLIAEIDQYVLEEACRQLAAWTREDPRWARCSVSVNLSGRQLNDTEVAARVGSTLERHGLAPSRLCLEITETALIGELGSAQRVVESLVELGVRIALDDFGTGYSTLAHLQQLRADVLKIDRSFVANITRRSRDREIIAALTAMAHALGMTVVAEGVETEVEREALAAVDCDRGQGYLFARPLPAEEVSKLRAAHDPHHRGEAPGGPARAAA